jgi:CDP-archaeol synthase
MSPFLQAVWMALPVVLGGLAHVAAIRLELLPSLARIPLDGGLTFRGRPLLGPNKTLRGVLVMIATTALASLALARLGNPTLAAVAPQTRWPLGWGACLGLGYLLGELPNSFLKRQFGVPPGGAAPGRGRFLFAFLDQADSLVGVVLMARWITPLPFLVLVWLLLLGLVIHPLVGCLMILLGLKHRLG